MKRIILSFLILFPVLIFAFTVPEKPTGFLQDYVGVLSSEESRALESKIENFEKQSTKEIAVVIISSLDGANIEDTAQEIFTQWGIGKKGENNGVLFLISVEDRKTRIHTGYGVEGDLTDIGTSYIQREVVAPAFREGKYYEGINGAVDTMIESLGGVNIVPQDYEDTPQKSKFPWDFIFLMLFVMLQFMTALLARSKSWWGGGVLGGIGALAIWYFFMNSLLLAIPIFILLVGFGLLFDFVISRAYQKHKDSGGGGSTPWFFGGGSGGRGGGGFGGFGGGSSGGGGSNGDW